MTFSADELEDGARAATGLHDFGSPYYREGLERTVDALNTEADLSDIGRVIQHATISNALIQRLKIEDTCSHHPEIDDETIGGPVFVIGLPRTGTTALSQLVAADPAARGGNPAHRPAHRASRSRPANAERHVPVDEDAVQLRSDRRDGMPGPDGNELSYLPFRRCRSGSRLPGVADGLRYAGDLHVPPPGAQTLAVALPTDRVAPEDAGPRVRTRCAGRGVSERQIHVES